MKLVLSLTIFTLCIPNHVLADLASETTLGVEAVTGYRSGYAYRGFELAGNTIDFQLETEIALGNKTSLSIGSWYATETGGGDFSESALFAQLSHQHSDRLTLGFKATCRDFRQEHDRIDEPQQVSVGPPHKVPVGPTHDVPVGPPHEVPVGPPHGSSDHDEANPSHRSVFKDGVDLGLFASWKFGADFITTAGAHYDFGADAWYGSVETEWSKIISSKSFISLSTGLSYVSDYYGRSGLNDAYGRLSLTHHISDTVSITPFVGGSILIDDDDEGDDQSFAGLWFALRF